MGRILFGIIALGLATAPTAHADEPSPSVVAYTAHFGGVVCDVLDEHSSFSGIIGISQAIQAEGFTAYQSGQIIGLSITETCPRHTGLMMRFARAYGGSYT